MSARREPFESLSPMDAWERLREAGAGGVYLDVRSEPEFEEGHPPDAWNLPLLHRTSYGMIPNREFEAVAARAIPRDALIVVGCRSGRRSITACLALRRLGFERLVNVEGGFHGSVDPETGDVRVPGWKACDLPTSDEGALGRSWEELRKSEG